MPISTLPKSAMKLWESVYNASKKAGDKTEVAARKAWAAVKGGWKKGKDGKWVKKSELVEFSMYITKASITNGTMTWAAVNSDTDPDLYNERMSVELYQDFINNIKSGNLPEKYKSGVCSEFWCGGMPYLSISHYPDLNGKAVPGEPLEIYIDGNKLKAKGLLYDNPLGHAVWRSLKEDKNKQPDEKIRISIGFLDMGHKHGDNGNLFVRDGLNSLCPECLEGIGDKIYMKGYLVHLALTRVPVNQRTEMVLEEKSMSKKKLTRKDDAASIVGESLAEEIELKNRVTTQRSDVLIEMSDVEETPEETAELIAEAEKTEGVEQTSEVVEEKVEEKVAEPVTEKSTFEDDAMEKVNTQPEKYVESLPMGGATTISDAEAYEDAKDELEFVVDSWEMFNTVAWNIFARDDVQNKKELLTKAVDDFRNILTAKAMVMFSQATAVTEYTKTHELQPAIDALLSAVDNSIQKSEVERAEVLNPMLQNLGSAITGYLAQKSVVEQPVPQNDDKDNLLETLKNLIQPLNDNIQQLSQKVGVLEAKSTAQTVETKTRIPQPRTAVVVPNLVQKPEVSNSSPTPKLRSIINKSVGLP